ncbi:hypothetical protein [Cyclobacterium sp.]|uniref:hypothetical protein n=1 Tax=Cyclobacterium sp. TaxID=1966343 RepID=UPI00198DC1A1|nr:hypothetical protein [Cyclobacterium sp.]MBD3627633.1 hypothetical protein [Cyclobacterium sp.]
MRALIKMLFNVKEETFHPILYFESPLPGNPENVVRYKSKGHRTIGLKTREEALATIKPEIEDKLQTMAYAIKKELDDDIPWDGEVIPADVQLRGSE